MGNQVFACVPHGADTVVVSQVLCWSGGKFRFVCANTRTHGATFHYVHTQHSRRQTKRVLFLTTEKMHKN